MPLGQFKQLIDSLKGFDFSQEMHDIADENKAVIADLQREQMSEGRGADGDWIRPFYSEDPFFKTPEAAKKYAEWKQRDFPNPKRPFDVPNLFINGYFHRSLFAKVDGDSFTIDSKGTQGLGDKVIEEHPNAIGLDEESREKFGETITLPEIKKRIQEKIGLIVK